VAMIAKIPVAHIHGGEITEGAFDESIRHSITKMSHLHFCSHEQYRNRIIQMGENPSMVFNFGAPGIDNILNIKLLSKNELEKQLDWEIPKKCALFTYHPETLVDNDLKKDLVTAFGVFEGSGLSVLFTYANADSGGRMINEMLEQFCKLNTSKYKVIKSLGQLNYLSALKHVDLLIGNSSSGIIEAGSFNKPVVNIGNRQSGRLKGGNIIDCNFNNLVESIETALSSNFVEYCQTQKNIYGDGNASNNIVNKLVSTPLSLTKNFIDIEL